MGDTSDFRAFMLRNAMAQAKLQRELARMERQIHATGLGERRIHKIKVDLMALNMEMNMRFQQEASNAVAPLRGIRPVSRTAPNDRSPAGDA
jgi:hypothetical protein